MSADVVLSVRRVGQLTGTTDSDQTDPRWPLLVDPEHWPLLTDTGPWGVIGVDLGANTEHGGRTYVFFGDVAQRSDSGLPDNADLVAWIDDLGVLETGGHLAIGWNFLLPTDPAPERQPDWRFCVKCQALFWDGDPGFKGVCHLDGQAHVAMGWTFHLPARELGAQDGQPDWRFCGRCAALFWSGDPGFQGVCPADGGAHLPLGWNFVVPSPPATFAGQPDWRYCGKCAGLHWSGAPHKGVCRGAPGGGLRLNAVTQANGLFAPFEGSDPIGRTLTLETPNGAFSYAGSVWVFAGFSDARYSGHVRPGDPLPGCYLASKTDPENAGVYQKEFLFSPRVGCCPRDAGRSSLESHEALGWKFLLAHDIVQVEGRRGGFRFCRQCASLVRSGADAGADRCHAGGAHRLEEADYVLPLVQQDTADVQSAWRTCTRCACVYWNGADNPGLCPAGGGHVPDDEMLGLAHPADLVEDMTHQAGWRYCVKCHAAVWTQQAPLFAWVAPCVVQNAKHAVLPPTPTAQGLVLFGFFYSSDPGIRLAWMPLDAPNPPRLEDLRYYAAGTDPPWRSDEQSATVLFPHANTYTHVSAAWFEDAARWVVLYSLANDESGPDGFHLPVVARIGRSLADWSEELVVFCPIEQQAYGRYMHRVGSDPIHPDIPPRQDTRTHPEHDGWAYGAFILTRYSHWSEAERVLTLTFLLSLSSPYQVQLMQARLRLGE